MYLVSWPLSSVSSLIVRRFLLLQSSRLRSQISILSLHTIVIECYILFRLSYLGKVFNLWIVVCPLYFMIKFWDFATKFWLALLHKFLNGHLRFAWVGWRPGLPALAAIFAYIKQIWDPEIKWQKTVIITNNNLPQTTLILKIQNWFKSPLSLSHLILAS